MILDNFKLERKRALVTGASAGLGRAIAIALAEAGAQAVACHGNARSPDDTCREVERRGAKAFAVIGDLSDTETPRRIFNDAREALGAIDILVNNAGTIRRAPAVEVAEDDWDFVLQVNLSSAWRLAQLVGREMIASRNASSSAASSAAGKIINIASLLSFQGGINVAAYTASKHGIAGVTKALANEWAQHRINVNAIAPGYIATDNTAALQADETRNRQILERIPAGRWGAPEDIAGACVFLASGASDYLHGHILTVDGGWMGR